MNRTRLRHSHAHQTCSLYWNSVESINGAQNSRIPEKKFIFASWKTPRREERREWGYIPNGSWVDWPKRDDKVWVLHHYVRTHKETWPWPQTWKFRAFQSSQLMCKIMNMIIRKDLWIRLMPWFFFVFLIDLRCPWLAISGWYTFYHHLLNSITPQKQTQLMCRGCTWCNTGFPSCWEGFHSCCLPLSFWAWMTSLLCKHIVALFCQI